MTSRALLPSFDSSTTRRVGKRIHSAYSMSKLLLLAVVIIVTVDVVMEAQAGGSGSEVETGVALSVPPLMSPPLPSSQSTPFMSWSTSRSGTPLSLDVSTDDSFAPIKRLGRPKSSAVWHHFVERIVDGTLKSFCRVPKANASGFCQYSVKGMCV